MTNEVEKFFYGEPKIARVTDWADFRNQCGRVFDTAATKAILGERCFKELVFSELIVNAPTEWHNVHFYIPHKDTGVSMADGQLTFRTGQFLPFVQLWSNGLEETYLGVRPGRWKDNLYTIAGNHDIPDKEALASFLQEHPELGCFGQYINMGNLVFPKQFWSNW